MIGALALAVRLRGARRHYQAATMSAPIATTRLQVRISTELHSMVKRAAEARGCSVSDFVIAALQEAAANVSSDVIHLSSKDYQRFVQALIAPPAQAPALARAIARSHKLLGSD